MVEFGPVPEKGRIRASTKKESKRVLGEVVSRPVLENGRIQASTGRGYNPCEY